MADCFRATWVGHSWACSASSVCRSAWGVLTPDTQEQALDRSGIKMGNKGREAAAAAVEMASVVAQLSAS